jgi:predicted  nucleic acid-binding Zn-ribbon protein
LLGSIAPQQSDLDQLNAEYNDLQRSLVCDGETNERMRALSARISKLHGDIQPVIEQIEILKPKYKRLQNTIS